MDLDAPIVAVTVHPGRARVTRRATVVVAAGPSELVLSDLPDTLLDDSVRVAGRGAGPVRVVGVDVVYRDLATVPDGRVRAAQDAVRAAERDSAAVEGADAADAARQGLLHRLALRSGDRLAAAIADGTATPGRVAEIGAAIAEQLVDVAAARRDHAERRVETEHARAAAQAELDRLRASGRQRREVRVGVEADPVAGDPAAGDTGVPVELEVTYAVVGAGWSTAYDGRVDAERLTLTCFGLITQATGEDWPACELTLSTAQPSAGGGVPELDPWWVDVRPPPVMAAMAKAVPLSFAASASAERPEAFTAVVAMPVEGTLSVAWRLPRPTAVPADGTPHRTTVSTATLDARLDHVTAPVLDPVAHLRAVAVNTTGTAILPGPLSAFVDGVFVGATHVEATAPGEELELALGVDDRVAITRELVGRTAGRTLLGGRRDAVETWTITARNGRPAAVHLVVRDRVPVSRHPDVQVVDVAVTPEPASRDDLGRVEWHADVAPGSRWEAQLRFGVRHARDLAVTGWR